MLICIEQRRKDFVPASASLYQPLEGLSSVCYVLFDEHTLREFVHPCKDHHGVPPCPSAQGPELLLCGPPVDISERLGDWHHQQNGMRPWGTEDGPHAWPLAVQARCRLRRTIRLGVSVFVAVAFTSVLRVTGYGPGRGVDHGDPPAVDLCVAHIAVGRLCPRVKDVIPQDGVGSGGLTRLRPTQDQQSALRGLSTPGIPCQTTERLDYAPLTKRSLIFSLPPRKKMILSFSCFNPVLSLQKFFSEMRTFLDYFPATYSVIPLFLCPPLFTTLVLHLSPPVSFSSVSLSHPTAPLTCLLFVFGSERRNVGVRPKATSSVHASFDGCHRRTRRFRGRWAEWCLHNTGSSLISPLLAAADTFHVICHVSWLQQQFPSTVGSKRWNHREFATHAVTIKGEPAAKVCSKGWKPTYQCQRQRTQQPSCV